MTLRFPLTINQGETWAVTFPVVDAVGAPANVTGWVGRAQVRRTPTEPVLYEWIASASNITVSGTSVTLRVPAATSSAWAWTSAAYDLELTDLAGVVTRIAQGPVRVRPETTH